MLKDYHDEARAMMDIEKFMSHPIVLFKIHHTLWEEIVEEMIIKLSSEKPELTLDVGVILDSVICNEGDYRIPECIQGITDTFSKSLNILQQSFLKLQEESNAMKASMNLILNMRDKPAPIHNNNQSKDVHNKLAMLENIISKQSKELTKLTSIVAENQSKLESANKITSNLQEKLTNQMTEDDTSVHHKTKTKQKTATIKTSQPPPLPGNQTSYADVTADSEKSVIDTNSETLSRNLPVSKQKPTVVKPMGNNSKPDFTLATKANSRNHKDAPPNTQTEPKKSTTTDKAGPPGRDTYKNYTVLLIHDENFQNFSRDNFSSRFNVHQYSVGSFLSLKKDSAKLNSMINRIRPDCVYIHLGINDFLHKKASIGNYVEQLSHHLLKTTDAQICFSHIIPSSNDTVLNDKIRLVNRETSRCVSWFHSKSSAARERLFTFSNESVGNHNTHTDKIGFRLRERGEKLLWLKLKDGITKTLRLPRENTVNNRNIRNNKRNIFSHE